MDLVSQGELDTAEAVLIYNEDEYGFEPETLSKITRLSKYHPKSFKEIGKITSGSDIFGHFQDSTYIMLICNNGDIIGCNTKRHTTYEFVKFPTGSKYHGVNDIEGNDVNDQEYHIGLVSCDDLVFVDGYFIPEANGVKYTASYTNNCSAIFCFLDRDDVLFVHSYHSGSLAKIVTERPLTKEEFFSLEINGESDEQESIYAADYPEFEYDEEISEDEDEYDDSEMSKLFKKCEIERLVIEFLEGMDLNDIVLSLMEFG